MRPGRVIAYILVIGFCLIAFFGPRSSAFRGWWMSFQNVDMVGELAPPLEGERWVGPESWPFALEPETDWRLLAFLSPT